MELTIREKNNYQVIDVIGQIDCLEDSKKLKSCIISLLEKERVKIVFNFSKTNYLGSNALNALIYAHKTIQKQNGVLAIIVQNEYIRDIIEVAGFDKLFTIYSTEKDFETATRDP